MSRIISALTALTRRMFSPAGPSAATSDLHRAWLSEQMKEYSVHKLYAGPLDGDLNATGETYEMRLAYRKALKEPAIKGPLLKKVYAVASLTPQVLAEDPDHPAGKESAAWVDYAITHARGGWPRLLHDCCIHPLIEGFAVGEKVAERIERGKWKDRWGLHAVKFKETKDLRFKLDRYRNVESVRSFAGGQGGHEFDTRDFVLLTHMPLWENPFGQSDMRAAYRAINLIEASIKLRAILLENFSGPFLVFKNSQPANVEQARAALSNARSRGYIVIDQQDELQVMNLATSGPDQFQQTIDDLRKEAATAIAGAYLQMLESGSPQGNSETHKGVSELFEWWLASTVAAALTEQLVPDLHDPHYADDVGRPRILLGGVDPNEATKQAEKLKTAKGLGLPLSKGQAYEILELEPPRDEGDALGGEQAPQAGGAGAGGAGASAGGAGGAGGPPPAGGGGGNPPGPQPTAGGPGGPGGAVAQSGPPQQSPAGQSVPPELLAAMVAAQQAGDEEAVDDLADLGSDPAALAAVIGDGVKAFADTAASFADARPERKEGEVWEGKNNRWYKRTNGRTVPTANPNADKSAGRDPAAPKRDVIAEARAAKEAREPGREAARTRWKAAVQDPRRVTADQIKSLADDLKTLTRDELRDMGKALRMSGSGLKEDVVRRLLEHVGAKGAGGPVKTTGQYGAWGRAAQPAVATPTAPAVATARPDGTPAAPEVKHVYTVDPKSLNVDASRFQYKVSGIKENGVTDELKGTSTWNPELGGTLLVWRDPADGKDYVINGHHRHELASRVGAEAVNVRYIDAPTAKEARARGALANIAEGRGTATDAAKYLRDSGQDIAHLKRAGISMSGKVAADAANLKDLSDGAFQKLTTGDLDEAKATAVARHLKDPALQDALFKKMDKREEEGKDWTSREIETAAKKMARAGKVTEAGTDLFGGFEDEKSTFDQEVELETHIGRSLQQAANDYAAVSNTGRAERVKGAGNVLATDENQKRKQAAAGMVQDFERESGLRSPVSDAIQKAAAELAGAKTKRQKDEIKQRVVESVRGILDGSVKPVAVGQSAPTDAGGSGAGGAGAPGVAGDAGVGAGEVGAAGGTSGRQPHEMTREEFEAELAKHDPTQFERRTEVDWGKMPRGSGKRAGQMVQGSMSDPPRGKKTYTDKLGELGLDDRQATNVKTQDEQSGGIERYVQARAMGLNHDDAFLAMVPESEGGGHAGLVAQHQRTKGDSDKNEDWKLRLPDTYEDFAITSERGKAVLAERHRELVKDALAAGKPVPPEVLADYPDLAAKYAATADATPADQPATAATTTATTTPPTHSLTTDDGDTLTYSRPTSHQALATLADLKAAGRDTSAVEVALTNAHTTDENPDISDRDHNRAVGRLLVGAMHDAERLGKTDAAQAAREVLAGTVGAEQIGDAGATVPFDPVRHESDGSISTGTPVRVDRAGHRIDEGGGREYVMAKAKVSATTSKTDASAGTSDPFDQPDAASRFASRVDGVSYGNKDDRDADDKAARKKNRKADKLTAKADALRDELDRAKANGESAMAAAKERHAAALKAADDAAKEADAAEARAKGLAGGAVGVPAMASGGAGEGKPPVSPPPAPPAAPEPEPEPDDGTPPKKASVPTREEMFQESVRSGKYQPDEEDSLRRRVAERHWGEVHAALARGEDVSHDYPELATAFAVPGETFADAASRLLADSASQRPGESYNDFLERVKVNRIALGARGGDYNGSHEGGHQAGSHAMGMLADHYVQPKNKGKFADLMQGKHAEFSKPGAPGRKFAPLAIYGAVRQAARAALTRLGVQDPVVYTTATGQTGVGNRDEVTKGWTEVGAERRETRERETQAGYEVGVRRSHGAEVGDLTPDGVIKDVRTVDGVTYAKLSGHTPRTRWQYEFDQATAEIRGLRKSLEPTYDSHHEVYKPVPDDYRAKVEARIAELNEITSRPRPEGQ